MFVGAKLAIVLAIAATLIAIFVLVYHPIWFANLIMAIIERGAEHDERRKLEKWRYPVIYFCYSILGLIVLAFWYYYIYLPGAG
jgi:hypothetical protein